MAITIVFVEMISYWSSDKQACLLLFFADVSFVIRHLRKTEKLREVDRIISLLNNSLLGSVLHMNPLKCVVRIHIDRTVST